MIQENKEKVIKTDYVKMRKFISWRLPGLKAYNKKKLSYPGKGGSQKKITKGH